MMKGINCMDEKKYLNEEKYQKTEKGITVFAILILVVGLFIGGFLIYRGIAKPATSKVDVLEKNLEEKRNELISKGIEYDKSSKYTDGEKYDLYIITNALDPIFSNCEFAEYKNNSITKDYCAAKNSISEFSNRTSIMFGAFICIATFMIFVSVLTFAKRRHILAFTTQQTMPVAKESIDEMAPTIGNAAGSIAKDITKGIKNGLEDKNDDNYRS